MENYKIFFENLCLINKKYNLINSKKEDFNIFSILRNEYDEVNLHSKFIVENKIYAEDQIGQLNRYYYSMINKNYSNAELEIVYLTLDGSEPDEESTKGLTKEIKEKIITISYKENIVEWLNDCIKEVA